MSIASRVVPGNLRDDHALAAEERIQERRLAHVRAPEDRHPDRLLPDRSLAAARKPPDDVVEQVAGAVAVQRRERDRVAEPEPVELERLGVAARVVQLVRDHEHVATGGAQDLGELLVPRRDSRLRVDHEEHEIGLLDRLSRLVGHLRPERARVLAVDAPGVDHAERRRRSTRSRAPSGRA